MVTAEDSLGLGVMYGGELFRGAKGISFNLDDFVMAADSNGKAAVLRPTDQAAERAILSPVAAMRGSGRRSASGRRLSWPLRASPPATMR